MRVIIFLVSLLFSHLAISNEVKIEVNPTKPVMGEVFQVFFRIYTDFDGEPQINFTPVKVEVVGKANQGVTTRTIYSNGQLTTTREITVVYELSAGDTGFAGLRDIKIELGNKNIRHPAVNFNVLKEPEQLGDVFLMADVPKKSLFLGEGIVVRYYLYSKVPVSNLDVKKYPKLNGFLKRFLQEPERSERVSVDGQIYLRNQIYAAKLFAEKVGELKVDPMYMAATILVTRGGDPFGSMGFGREMKSKSLSSELIKVEVKPLPEAGKPANFTGLVGKHDFDLQLNQTRLIVNEPLELKLTVTGSGALENLEAPTILNNPAFEEFETNGDLKIMDASLATKVFDYTFLAKSELDLPESQVILSYFDPDSMRYVPVELKLPQIAIAGGGQPSPVVPNKSIPSAKKLEIPEATVPKSVPEPVLTSQTNNWLKWVPFLNMGLALIAIVLALGFGFKGFQLPSFSKNHIPSSFKRGQFQLSEFATWLNPLILKTGKSPTNLIKDSDLSQESKTYFIDLLSTNDYKDYAPSKTNMNFKYRSECFKELDNYIQSQTHEDHSSIT